VIFPTIKRRIDGQPGVAGKLFLSLFFFVFSPPACCSPR